MVEIKITEGKSKGKFCHFEKKDFIRHKLDHYYKPIDEVDLIELRDTIKGILLDEGFVFYEDSLEYKYRNHKGNLVEFAIQFFHIN